MAARWWWDGGPRRLIERTPVGVPLGGLAAAGALAVGDVAGVVPEPLAWCLGSVLFLGAYMYFLYGFIAWRRAHDPAPPDRTPRRLLDPTEVEVAELHGGRASDGDRP